MQKRPNSSIGFCSIQGNIENQQPRTNLKKVKVLCQPSNNPSILSSPQPLLASSSSQKNINMVKALQQINHLIQSQNYSNSLQSINQVTSTSNYNSIGGNAVNLGLKTTQSTKNLMQPQQQINLIKSPKIAGQSMISIPLSLQSTSANQTQVKLKQLQQKTTGQLLQKCESSHSLQGTNAKKQPSKQKIQHENSLSPSAKEGSLQRTNKHNRQSTMINFNIQSSVTKSNHHQQQKSLSPSNQKQTMNIKQNQIKGESNERVKALDNQSIEIISKAINGGYNEHQSIEKEGRATQHIRISPQKQFIVHPCITQQTSPQEQFKKQSIKLNLKNPYSTKSNNNNVILEQDDYLLPNSSQNNDTQEYSLKKDYRKMVNHNHNMKNDQIPQLQKDSEESVNKGFLTDRQQASNNEIENHIMMDNQQRQKKTKGISYTRNAQELKKLLLETGVIGNLGLTSSLATAAAGMISSTQDTLYMKNIDTSKNGQNTQKSSQTAKVKNSEVFSFSARNKTGVHKVNNHHHKSSEKTSTCILENKMLMSKAQHKRMQSQLENSVQTQKPMINGLFQTLDKNSEMGNFPSSTQNNQQQQLQLHDFILKDDEESNHNYQYNNYLDDQVIFKSKRHSPKSNVHQNNLPSRRSPSSYLNNKEDVSQSNINFPFTETEQLIYRNDTNKGHLYSGSVIDVQNQQTRLLNRCWTAHGDISTDREHNKENFLLKDPEQNINFYQIQQQFENSQIDSVGGAPLQAFTFSAQNKHNLSSQKQSQQNLNFAKRQSGISSQSKNTCFTYAQSPVNRQYFSSMISEENAKPNRLISQKQSLGDMKEMEILKFKMIAFVKTYENQFQKMQLQMNDLRQENKSLKRKLNHMSMRRMSATTNKTSQSTSIAVSKTGGYVMQNPTCQTTAHSSQINL